MLSLLKVFNKLSPIVLAAFIRAVKSGLFVESMGVGTVTIKTSGGNSLPVNPTLSERINHLGRNLHEDKKNPILGGSTNLIPGITPPGSGTGSKNSSSDFVLKGVDGKPIPTTK